MEGEPGFADAGLAEEDGESLGDEVGNEPLGFGLVVGSEQGGEWDGVEVGVGGKGVHDGGLL